MSKADDCFDLIIIGVGAMGSAALYQAAQAGLRVLGIDRYQPPHEFGSSHAETRISRLAVAEGADYLPFVARSHEIWQEIYAKTGKPLFHQTGGYMIGRKGTTQTNHYRWGEFIQRTSEIATAANIPFERRTPQEVGRHLPNVVLRNDDEIGYEPSAGVVLSEEAIRTQIELALTLGATLHVNEPVLAVDHQANGVTVKTAHHCYQAPKVIVMAGPWVHDFIPPTKQALLRVTRQAVYWFETETREQFSTDNFPFLMWLGDRPEDAMGVFPIPPNGVPGLKMLTEQLHTTTNPHEVSRVVTPEETAQFYEQFVPQTLRGVTPNCVKSAVCLYTSTPNDHFIIDYHPDSERVIIASPCSGHGFKHSAAMGEALVQLATAGKSDLDLTPFHWACFELP